MNLREFKRDYPEEFEEAVNDINWPRIFKGMAVNKSMSEHIEAEISIVHYLKDHFDSAREAVEPQVFDHDFAGEQARQRKSELSFDDVVNITNMRREK